MRDLCLGGCNGIVLYGMVWYNTGMYEKTGCTRFVPYQIVLYIASTRLFYIIYLCLVEGDRTRNAKPCISTEADLRTDWFFSRTKSFLEAFSEETLAWGVDGCNLSSSSA